MINVVFTVKNLSQNERFKSNFLIMIQSLFENTSIDDLQLFVIGDEQSEKYVENILQKLHYPHQIHKFHLDEIAQIHQHRISPLIEQFSSDHNYYKDPLFFLSPLLHEILPENIERVIMIDIDIRFDDDIRRLFQFFDQFDSKQIFGIARENQPVYRHLLWKYREENPQTLVGAPPPNGLTGFNSGVLLLDLKKIRQSNLFQQYLNNSILIERLKQKYYFLHPHLGDQDFYSLLSFEHSDLFFILPCSWNRQLCTWWKGKGYDEIWENYFNCNNDENISLYHGNCNTPIPVRSIQSKVEL